MYNRDSERQQYEDWHRLGRERGFFDRARDEVKSWFGDEEAERRRRMDSQMHHSRGGGFWGGSSGDHDDERHERHNSEPGWHHRDYAGGSPRGAELEERGRYDMEMGGMRRMRQQQREQSGMGGGYGREMGGGHGRETGGGSGREMGGGYGRQSFGNEGRYGREEYGMGQRQEMRGGPAHFFDRGQERDMESGMGWGSEGRQRSDRNFEQEQSWGREPKRGMFGQEQQRGGMFGQEHRGGMFGDREENRGMFGQRGGMFGESGLLGGMHRGRGPRAYQRSDERISDEIHQLLTFHPEIDASDIEVLVEKGVVTLRGKIDHRTTKRLTEDLCEDVYGVREVHNELRVENGLFQRTERTDGTPKNNLINR